jgi:hypothetical protein
MGSLKPPERQVASSRPPTTNQTTRCRAVRWRLGRPARLAPDRRRCGHAVATGTNLDTKCPTEIGRSGTAAVSSADDHDTLRLARHWRAAASQDDRQSDTRRHQRVVKGVQRTASLVLADGVQRFSTCLGPG